MALRECLQQYQSKKRRVHQVKELRRRLLSEGEDSEDEYEADQESQPAPNGQEALAAGGPHSDDGGIPPCLAVSFPKEESGKLHAPPSRGTASNPRAVLARRRPSL